MQVSTSYVNRKVPRDVDFIVAKALHLEPEERYASVDELSCDLRAVLDCRPVQARSGSAWHLVQKFLAASMGARGSDGARDRQPSGGMVRR